MASAPSGAREQFPYRRKVAPDDRRVFGKRNDHRRDDVQQRGPVTLDEFEIGVQLELRHDDNRRAGPEAEQADHLD
jgi:hypothetical protein